MEELKEVLDSAVFNIMSLEDKVNTLEFQNSFLKGELRNCKRIFEHEKQLGYSFYVSKALEMVGEKCEIS